MELFNVFVKSLISGMGHATGSLIVALPVLYTLLPTAVNVVESKRNTNTENKPKYSTEVLNRNYFGPLNNAIPL
jgi:hypothetical protein